MTIHILGVSALFHDSAAALLRDGDIVAAAQEERFTRKKHDPGFPREAIDYCLREGKVAAGDLDHVVYYEDPRMKFDRLLETQILVAPDGFELFREAFPRWARHKLDVTQLIVEALGPEFGGTIGCFEHHESHAASAFYPSPFEEAATLTLDAVGEWATSSIGVGTGNQLQIRYEQRFPNSLGMLYSAFTGYAGFKVNSGEYKLMGLAPYGEPRFVDLILSRLVDLREDGSLGLDMSYFNFTRGAPMTAPRFHDLFGGLPREPSSTITQKAMDVAASIQVVCEEAVLRSARFAHDQTGMDRLVMAGGVALNCVANGRLLREGPFQEVWVQPAAGDAGGALGAAYLQWHRKLGSRRQVKRCDNQKGSLLGPRFGTDDVEIFLQSAGATYRRFHDEAELLDRVASLLDQGKVIGWFHGRMEYGPRALGARSIIGDARSAEMQRTMNLKIKFRESFRPFAPCVLEAFANDVFELEPANQSPYMLLVAPVREEWRIPLDDAQREKLEDPDLRVRLSVPRSRIPAVTHVDYSARIQTVDSERHGRFYRMMLRFHQMTGCPVIVNTSFNIRGEPIVCTPEDAWRCFMGTAMDCLVVEDCLLLKDAQPQELRVDSVEYQSQFELD